MFMNLMVKLCTLFNNLAVKKFGIEKVHTFDEFSDEKRCTMFMNLEVMSKSDLVFFIYTTKES